MTSDRPYFSHFSLYSSATELAIVLAIVWLYCANGYSRHSPQTLSLDVYQETMFVGTLPYMINFATSPCYLVKLIIIKNVLDLQENRSTFLAIESSSVLKLEKCRGK